jgi:hypothetical protein
MDKKIVLTVVAVMIGVITILLMMPAKDTNIPETLPWKISHPTPDTTRVFGITLGVSTLSEMDRLFHEQAEISLFKTTEGKMLVEAFYDELNFNGLKAKFVMTLAVPEAELPAIYHRGLRMNSTPSGKRITLSFEDTARVREAAVASLTYLPSARLEEALFSKRFGPADQRIKEKKTGTIHWLYPKLGLDITLGGSEKSVLQYVAPRDFELIRAPLLAQGEVLP